MAPYRAHTFHYNHSPTLIKKVSLEVGPAAEFASRLALVVWKWESGGCPMMCNEVTCHCWFSDSDMMAQYQLSSDCAQPPHHFHISLHIQATSSLHTHPLPSTWTALNQFETLQSCCDEDMVTVSLIDPALWVIWSHQAEHLNCTRCPLYFPHFSIGCSEPSFLLLSSCAVLQLAYTLQKPTSIAIQPGAH